MEKPKNLVLLVIYSHSKRKKCVQCLIFFCEFDKFHAKPYASREKEILKSKHPHYRLFPLLCIICSIPYMPPIFHLLSYSLMQ